MHSQNLRSYRLLLLIICCTALMLVACNFNTHWNNREEDKAEAEQVMNAFYALQQSDRFRETIPFYSDRFLEVTDTAWILNIYKSRDENLGPMESKELAACQTLIIKGSKPSSQYLLVYTVRHQKFDAREEFRLEKEADGQIRIMAYNLQSDGLLQEP
jgi:hypothetical protein